MAGFQDFMTCLKCGYEGGNLHVAKNGLAEFWCPICRYQSKGEMSGNKYIAKEDYCMKAHTDVIKVAKLIAKSLNKSEFFEVLGDRMLDGYSDFEMLIWPDLLGKRRQNISVRDFKVGFFLYLLEKS